MPEANQEAGPSALSSELRLDHLNAFYTSHNKIPPRLPYQRAPLNMQQLWDLVQKEGGYAEACKKKRWASIARDMGAGPSSTDASFVMRNLYIRSLLPYENFLRGEEVVFSERGKRKHADTTNAPKTTSKTSSKAAGAGAQERKKKKNDTSKYISESDLSSSESEEIEDSDTSDSDFELEGRAMEKERAKTAQPKTTIRSPGGGSRGGRGRGGAGRGRVSDDGRVVPQRNAKTATETAAMAAEQLVTLATNRARRTSTGRNGTDTAARGARGGEGGTPAWARTGTGGRGRGKTGGGRGRGGGRGGVRAAGRATPRVAKAAAAATANSSRSESPYTSDSDLENEEDVVDVGKGASAPHAVAAAGGGGGQAPRMAGGANGSRGFSGRANLLAELEAASKPQQDWSSAAETTLDGCKAAFRMALLAAQATPKDGSPDALLHVAAGLVAVTADELTRLCHENAYLKRTAQAADKRAFAAELETATARGAAAEAKRAFSTLAQHQQQHQQRQQHGGVSPHGAL